MSLIYNLIMVNNYRSSLFVTFKVHFIHNLVIQIKMNININDDQYNF